MMETSTLLSADDWAEHVNSSIKRCRILKGVCRLLRSGVRDLVMEICCALHTFPGFHGKRKNSALDLRHVPFTRHRNNNSVGLSVVFVRKATTVR